MKILIIDDEPLVRRSLARALQQRQHQVFEAADGVAGLALWKEQRPELVFIDVLMPGLTGPQVLQEIAEDLRKATRVVMMSAFTGEALPRPKLEVTPDLFLPKPFEDIFEVIDLAERLVHNG